MSLFNFNPSGLLGSGAFALDPSKFNFSNISAPSTTPDPMDIVAPKPEPEVKYSPVVEQAIQGGMLFTQEPAVKSGVKPTPVVEPQAPTMAISDSVPNTISQGLANIQPQQQNTNVNIKSLEEARLGGNPFSVGNDLAQSIRDARQTTEETRGFEFGIGEDMFQDERQNQGFIETALGTNVRAGNLGRLTELQDAQTANMLRAQGLQPVYEQDEYRGYRYNPTTGQYDYYDYTPSLIDQAVPALIQAGVMGVATAGLGSALSGGLGVAGSAVGTGVTNAVVNAGLQQAMTGDVDLIQAATAGFNAGLNSYADATKTAVEAAGTIGATAEMADTARNMQSTLEVLETVKDTINLAEAVDDKNVLGAIDISLGMADLPNTKTFVADKLQETFPDNDIVTRHADSLASATIKAGVKLAEGESVGDAVKSGLLEYVKQGGGLGIDMPDINFEIDFGLGESDMLGRIDQWIRDLPTTKEDWERWENNVKNSADSVVRALPTTKEDWQNLERIIKDGAGVVKTTVVDPVVSVVRETGRAVEEGYDTVEDWVKDNAPDVDISLPDAPDAPDIDLPSVDLPEPPDIDVPDLFGDSTQQQEQEEYGNIIGYDDMGMPIYDNTIEILANQLLTNQN